MTGFEIVANNVKRYRILKGLKQTDLAWAIKISGDYFSKIERAKTKNIGLKYLIRICEELDIELFQLFLEDPDELNIKLIVGKENLKSLERVLDMINKQVEIRFKVDTEKPIFYHPQDCGCEKCKEKGGEKNGNNKGD